MAFNVGAWDFSRYGGSGFGMKDVQAAHGASTYQLHQLVDRARREGLNVGGAVMDAIGPRPSAPTNYGSQGGWGFGMADIEALGYDYDKVKDAKQWASQHGLDVGPGARNWFADQTATRETNRRIEAERIFQEQMLAQQAAADAENLRIQQEMADQAARVKGNTPTGVGGAASIKGSRLSITQKTGRKGTKQFSRPTQYMNPLGGLGASTASTGKSTLNL